MVFWPGRDDQPHSIVGVLIAHLLSVTARIAGVVRVDRREGATERTDDVHSFTDVVQMVIVRNSDHRTGLTEQ